MSPSTRTNCPSRVIFLHGSPALWLHTSFWWVLCASTLGFEGYHPEKYFHMQWGFPQRENNTTHCTGLTGNIPANFRRALKFPSDSLSWEIIPSGVSLWAEGRAGRLWWAKPSHCPFPRQEQMVYFQIAVTCENDTRFNMSGPAYKPLWGHGLAH